MSLETSVAAPGIINCSSFREEQPLCIRMKRRRDLHTRDYGGTWFSVLLFSLFDFSPPLFLLSAMNFVPPELLFWGVFEQLK